MAMRGFFILIAILIVGPPITQALADSLYEVHPLTYGMLWVRDAAPQNIVVQPNGTETPTSGILVFHPGTAGLYQVTHLPPSSAFTIAVSDTTLDGPSGATFDITDFAFIPANSSNPQADGTGTAMIKIGATLATRSATTYAPGAYRGTYTLMLNF